MRYFFTLTGLIVLISLPLFAQNEIQPTFEDTLQVYEDLFGLREPLTLTLKFNIKEFQKSKRNEKYHKAEMTCHVREGFEVKHNVRVRARGKLRRDICYMPPFWLNIRYAGIEAEDLAEVIKMKVVTRCRGASIYENYVLREYLVYQIYNLLSPYSFNTRLVRLKYIDTGRKDKVSEDWGFIIEPEGLMAERNKAMAIKSDKLSLATVNKEWMDKMAYFNYMVGMCDYSVTGRHNLKILTLKEYGPTGFIPVPYDFDYTGLVDATYAVPEENLGLTTVRERYYLGKCRSEEVHQKTIDWLASHRDEIKELILSFEYLDERERLEMANYIESYYRESEQKSFIGRRIQPTCR
ncbi:MAG: hypothetical protein KAS82_08000 [Bacteroidales bacterium]|nr:hypothetical protein [Bacteroidales bacterium]